VSDSLHDLLELGPISINVGLQDFAESLAVQGAEVVHVLWRPPAGGDPEMMDLLDQLL
jgi:FdrA protein